MANPLVDEDYQNANSAGWAPMQLSWQTKDDVIGFSTAGLDDK
jgi:hypothetical protein